MIAPAGGCGTPARNARGGSPSRTDAATWLAGKQRICVGGRGEAEAFSRSQPRHAARPACSQAQLDSVQLGSLLLGALGVTLTPTCGSVSTDPEMDTELTASPQKGTVGGGATGRSAWGSRAAPAGSAIAASASAKQCTARRRRMLTGLGVARSARQPVAASLHHRWRGN